MADQWEMCELDPGGDQLDIFTPKEAQRMSEKDFIKRQQITGIHGYNKDATCVCLLLSDGWEPFAATDRKFIFRRKYQG